MDEKGLQGEVRTRGVSELWNEGKVGGRAWAHPGPSIRIPIKAI